jgi:copper transport protein
MNEHSRHVARRFCLALLMWAALATACFAHASLLRASPTDGATLLSGPPKIELTFNEPVNLLQATLLTSGGDAHPLDATGTGGRIVVALPNDLGNGGYALAWRIVSEDGHPVSGTVAFTIGAGSATVTERHNAGDAGRSIVLVVARAILFCALFIGVGASAFQAVVGSLPRSSTHLSLALIGAGCLAAVAIIGLQGLDMCGLALVGLFDPATWWMGLQSSYTTTSALSLLSFVLAAVGLRRTRGLVSTTAGPLAMLVAGMAISMSGHASTADPQWLTRTALVIHIAAIAIWVGALHPLFILLSANDEAGRVALVRFSRLIPVPVALLFCSGIALAAVQMGPLGATWLSPYGIVLACKLLVVGLVMCLACYNRWALTAPASRREPTAVRRLRRAIVLEMILIVIVLVLTSTWRFTTPPRAIETASVMQLLASTEKFHAVMETVETAEGVEFDVQLTDPMQQPIAARSIVAIFVPTGDGLLPMEAPLHRMGESWTTMTTLPISGLATQWTVELRVRIDDFDQARVPLHAE